MLTSEQVAFGHADQVIARRQAVLRKAWAAHPDRFEDGEAVDVDLVDYH